MTKFEIKTDNFEFRFGTSKDSIPSMREDEVFADYLTETANDPVTVATFDTLEAAQEEFSKYYSNYGRTKAEKSFTFWLLVGEVAWLEESVYNENGECEYLDSIHDISAEAYESEDN